IMRDWFLNLSIPWMAFIIFAATYVVAACVYLAVVRLAVGDRASAFKALSPAMLPPLGTIFGLLVAFVAVQVWNDSDKAKLAVATEASALRAVVVFADTLPDEQRMHLRALVNHHIDEATNRDGQRWRIRTSRSHPWLPTWSKPRNSRSRWTRKTSLNARPSGRSWPRCIELWMRVSASSSVNPG